MKESIKHAWRDHGLLCQPALYIPLLYYCTTVLLVSRLPTRTKPATCTFRRLREYTPECAGFGNHGGTEPRCTPAWWRSYGRNRRSTWARSGRRQACNCTRALPARRACHLFVIPKEGQRVSIISKRRTLFHAAWRWCGTARPRT